MRRGRWGLLPRLHPQAAAGPSRAASPGASRPPQGASAREPAAAAATPCGEVGAGPGGGPRGGGAGAAAGGTPWGLGVERLGPTEGARTCRWRETAELSQSQAREGKGPTD